MRAQREQLGYGYLLLLFAMALAGAALAAAGTRWQVALQREREAELIFRATQVREAIERYIAATPAGQPAAPPPTLDALLEDRRGPTPRHWLRRAYADPFLEQTGDSATGQAGWLLLRDAQGGVVGVASRSRAHALRQRGVPAELAETATAPLRVGDWHFRADLERAERLRARRATNDKQNDPRSPP